MTELLAMARPAARRRFRILLPALFAGGALLGVLWPGHAGQLFWIGGLAGVWACFVCSAGSSPAAWLLPTLAAGAPILWFLGRQLDRLQADLTLWLVSFAVLSAGAGFVLLQGYEDLEQAIEFHGSLLAYGVCALQLGSYGATLVLLLVGAGQGTRAIG